MPSHWLPLLSALAALGAGVCYLVVARANPSSRGPPGWMLVAATVLTLLAIVVALS